MAAPSSVFRDSRKAPLGAALLLLLAGNALSCPSADQPTTPAKRTNYTAATEWIDLAGIEQRVAAAKGQVVIVNYWATWCEPCREEFPDFVRFYDQHRDRGLTLLSISLDSPSVRDTLVKKFLAEQRPPFPVFQRRAGDDDAFINAVDPEWSGSLPATFIYDRSGQRRHALYDPQNLESLEDYVQPML